MTTNSNNAKGTAGTARQIVKEGPAATSTPAVVPTPASTPTPAPTSGGAPPTLIFKKRTPEDRIKYISQLIHGDSGAGKTAYCGTMIKTIKVLYITFDESELLTLDQRGIYDYDYRIITKYEQIWNTYLALRKNEGKWDGFAFDGLTFMQQEAKNYELAANGKIDAEFMKSAMLGGKRMFLQNWGNLLEMTRQFIVPATRLPMHKIITCVSEPDNDPITGKPVVYPALQGSLQQMIKALFSVVGYCYVQNYAGKTHFCLATQPHPSISTKDRTRLSRVLINPKFQTFLDALDGKYPEITKLQETFASSLIISPETTKVKVEDKK